MPAPAFEAPAVKQQFGVDAVYVSATDLWRLSWKKAVPLRPDRIFILICRGETEVDKSGSPPILLCKEVETLSA